MKYPKRGCMSDDGKYYTHTDGSVHDLGHPKDHVSACKGCSLVDACNETSLEKGLLCGQRGPFQKISGAYVPSDEEQAACDAMILGIEECGYRNRLFRLDIEPEFHGKGCSVCPLLTEKTCPLRVYLAEHHQPDAWEVSNAQ